MHKTMGLTRGWKLAMRVYATSFSQVTECVELVIALCIKDRLFVTSPVGLQNQHMLCEAQHTVVQGLMLNNGRPLRRT